MNLQKLILTCGIVLTSMTAMAQTPEEITPLTKVTLADGRNILADADSLTVYSFDPDGTGGVSTCFDKCAQKWPPVLVDAATVVGGRIGKTQRPEGTFQITFDGKPMYGFVNDAEPGDITGDGVGGIWHILVLQ